MSRTWIQLARAGDILSILPLLWMDAQRGERPRLMVQREYASLLEGISYVDPVIFEGAPHEIGKAVEQARQLGEWVCTQVNAGKDDVLEYVYGPAGMENARTTSFQKEQWRVAGRLGDWDSCPPLVFDRRNPEREEKLVAKVMTSKKAKTVLVHVDGISSPFPYKDLLFELLKSCGYAIVDLGKVKAERFYDLLGLYERAHCLICADSAPLHLADACPKLPVLALTNDRPMLWHGSSWKPNHEWYCRYHDFPERAVEMLDVIRFINKRDTSSKVVEMWNSIGKLLQPKPSPWRQTPITSGMCGRLGPLDSPKSPYLKDCIRMGIQRAGNGKLCIRRDGVQFAPETTKHIEEMSRPCYAYRVVDGEEKRVSPIVDMLCADSKIWKEMLPSLPDLLLGGDFFWSHVLWILFKKAGAVDITGSVSRQPTPSKKGQAISPVASYNSDLCKAFVTNNRATSRYPKVSDQIETMPLDLSKLKPFGYNPTIIEDNGFMLLAYRYHPDKTPSTRLALSQIDVDGTVVSTVEPTVEGTSVEDPRFFTKNGKVFVSFVVSTWPEMPTKSVVKFGEVVNGRIENIFQPELPGNDWTTMQKNYVMWEDNILTQCHPDQQVTDCSTWNNTPGPRWIWGPIKGGTRPVEYEGAFLRFFHSTIDTEWDFPRRRYFVGAYLMEKKPPFKVLRVSSSPILYGSEIDNVKYKERPHHWKGNVVFPAGIIERNDGWILSCGVNDSACLLVKITPSYLNL